VSQPVYSRAQVLIAAVPQVKLLEYLVELELVLDLKLLDAQFLRVVSTWCSWNYFLT
jgi:hypothetical protein